MTTLRCMARTALDAIRGRSVARREWKPFLDEFSLRHEGWLTSLQSGPDGAQEEARTRYLPLRRIEFDTGADRIRIDLGEGTARAIEAPLALHVDESEDGAEWGLGIRSSGGNLHLRFRSSFPTEMVDGIARRSR